MQAKILCIERKRTEGPTFSPGLRKKDFLVETVLTGSEAVQKLVVFLPDLVIINAASLRTNGKRICKSLRESSDKMPIFLIIDQDNSFYAPSCADVVLRLPFTTRKLLNRMVPFLKGNPDKTIQQGEIKLDLERKTVRCRDREVRLTPRLVALLVLLMQNTGTVLSREYLFTTVWKTTYTGDTRTLDVHISWLRQALEVDPRQPVFLKTVRGMGYRLDA